MIADYTIVQETLWEWLKTDTIAIFKILNILQSVGITVVAG